jgi:hypothetical protein
MAKKGNWFTKLFKSIVDPIGALSGGKYHSPFGYIPGLAAGEKDTGAGGADADTTAPITTTPISPVLNPQEEMDKLVQQRMARLGKYFTSPTGVLGGANTGSAKVFS